MSTRARICMAAASLCLGGAFFLPLWYIGLVAPQYPEGLGMMIGINTIAGINPHDLDNINELNHYIGMKVIDPGSIPELRLFPWIVSALIVLGLVAALWGKRSLVIGWLGSMVGLAIAGGLDFWRWTYDYGHNLDLEHAIIKVPDAVYQPPLIGSKQILNFTATSWPGAGVWCAVVAFVIGMVALFLSRRSAPRRVEAVLASPECADGACRCSREPPALASPVAPAHR